MYFHYRYGKRPFNPELVALININPISPVQAFNWVDQNDNQFIDQEGNTIVFVEPV